MADAVRLESRLTKDQILSLYVSFVPLGRNTRGIGAGAWTYFGRDISTLSAAQVLALAVIPRNPTLYDPLDHPDALIAEAARIARDKALHIDAGEIARAVRGARQGRPPGSAPHYTRYVAGEVAAGRARAVSGDVKTSLDSELNDYVQGRVRFHLERYSAARITNAAVVAIDNATGSVVGWVGSRDFTDFASQGQIDGVLIRRQSASTLKPFLYALAIEKGWTAATLLPDVPLVFGAADEEAYRPENFDNRSHGVVRLRTALASSLNVPAVYTLSRVGLSDFLGTLGKLGFSLPADAEKAYGLGAAIGNAEVSLLELTRAFSVFPRGGTLPQPGGSRRDFDPFASWMICNILSDPSARATGFGTRTYFRTQYPAMFKTGTSSEFTNLWCVGATSRYTVGAWAGNFDGRAVINKTGSIVPTQIVVDALDWLTAHDTRPAGSFARPGGIAQARICTLSGERATAFCPSVRTEYFRNEAEVPAPCQYHAGGARGEASRDALLKEKSFLTARDAVRILFPANSQVFYADETLRSGAQGIPVSLASRAGEEVSVSYDGVDVARGAPPPAIVLPLSRGVHSVVARTTAGSDRVLFEVR
jgi:penicillin-binding protein 1C